jgi:hypothetical protein
MMSFLSGCLHKKKNYLEKKLFVPQSKCAQKTVDDCSTACPPATVTNPAVEQPMITVWIHGTKETMRILKHIRPVTRFFYTPYNVNPIETLDCSMHHRLIGENLIEGDPFDFPRGHVYLFGWTGRLSFESRENAACELRQGLDELIKKYQTEYGYTPKIRLITHSHGGNVALNLAAIKDNFSTELSIEQLIMLACPVQDKTECLVKDPMFKHVYSLYSTKDFLQIADAQGAYLSQKHKTKTLLSRRRFDPAPNLVQVKIKINRRPISHIEFMLSRFVRLIPCIIKEINSWENDPCAAPDTELILAIYTHVYKHPHRLRS